jgi:DNA gyrase/topoisomerase IV subunit B
MKEYTDKDIRVLSDEEHVRIRTSIYMGNMTATEYNIPIFINNDFNITPITFIPAVYKAVGEILDNSIDEFSHISIKNKHLKITANPILGNYTISDNGRGVPISKHSTGKHTPEVVFGSLRSGRNFENDKQEGVIGMNGVGSSCVNFVSTEFSIDITRDKKRYQQTFSNGASKKTRPSITKTTVSKTGTTIKFQLDDTIFDDITLPEQLMENRAIELAITNPGITVEYNNTKYKFKHGFDDIIKKISNDYYKFSTTNIEFYVVFDVIDNVDESIFSWVNSSLLFDGGLCNTQFINAFITTTINQLQPAAKKAKSIVNKNDIRQNLLIFGNLKISDPQYDAQSKTRLTGPNLRKELSEMIENEWTKFVRKNQQWLDVVLERAIIRHHINENFKAVNDHKKSIKRKVPGLIDATSTNRFECQLLLTEGDSAASQISDARNSKTTASLPLRGKVNNTYGMSVAQLLNLPKVANMITAVGLIPGKKPLRSELNYGKLILATDADFDGDDIFTLLINVLYQFWPNLFDPEYEPFVYRLIAPNVCVSKGNTRIHFPSMQEYEKKKKKYENWTIEYFKGLGSMSKRDWNMILTGKSDTLIPIIDDGNIKNVLRLLFSPNSDDRKNWLQGN